MRCQPWMDRTRDQKDANEFDCDLYRLILRAERKATEAVPRDRAQWAEVYNLLRSARGPVRKMMHKDDVAETA